MRIKDAIKQLKEYDKETPVIMTIWLPDDVTTMAKIDDVEITQEQADTIIDEMDYSANEGDPMWQVLSEAIRDLEQESDKNA